jgi:two-component system OmpR family response regulator
MYEPRKPTAPESAEAKDTEPDSARILLVEDDSSLASEVALYLELNGHLITCVGDGAEALDVPGIENFDLFIVDRMLPSLDGLTLIERLRVRGVRTPVLVVSALGAVDERVRGLKAGGDDYLTKPFALVELAARVEALLRRPLDTRQTLVHAGPLVMDLIKRTVTRDGKLIELQPREFKLLEYFMRRPGQLITRTMLLEEVWNYRFVLQTNLIDVHIGKLRRKIDGGCEPSLIESVRGAGFVFAPP